MHFFRTLARTRKRVRQRATRYSLLVVVLLFGLFLEAYMHNFNLVYIMLFFVFSSAFSAGTFGLFNLGRLEVAFGHCERLFAKKEGRCFFRISNPATTHAWAIRLHCDETVTELGRIEAHRTIQAAIRITPQKRGRLRCSDCSLQSLFPLSTVRFVLSFEPCLDTVVYPYPSGEPLHSFLMRQKAAFGEESDFDGLQAYSGTENLSRIHWPSVAKGEPAVKSFEHEGRMEKLEFDFYLAGKSDEERLSQLCLWVLECEKIGVPFVIRMPHKKYYSDKEGIDAILETLSLY